MTSRLYSLLLTIFLLTIDLTSTVSADMVYEDGYTVTTILNGNKLNLNPQSLLPLPGSQDLLILDSSTSSFFTLSFPTSHKDRMVERYAGNGSEGYMDGDLGSAMFRKPKSFAVDSKGNAYVADMKNNHAIRKISKSGVTTIAGGYSPKAGNADGPGQDALFSDDIELSFVPEICALMISDHGNKLVRQINLKSEDCASGSQQSVLGTASTWALGLGVSCLVGLLVGFVIRPYVSLYGGSGPLCFSGTWKHCLISLGRQIRILCCEIRSGVANSTPYAIFRRLIMLSLSHLSLMFRYNTVKSRPLHEKFISLLDSDHLGSSEITKSQVLADQLKDMITLDGDQNLLDAMDKKSDGRAENKERSDVFLSDGEGEIDKMIQANIMGFLELSQRASTAESRESSSGLIKRR